MALQKHVKIHQNNMHVLFQPEIKMNTLHTTMVLKHLRFGDNLSGCGGGDQGHPSGPTCGATARLHEFCFLNQLWFWVFVGLRCDQLATTGSALVAPTSFSRATWGLMSFQPTITAWGVRCVFCTRMEAWVRVWGGGQPFGWANMFIKYMCVIYASLVFPRVTIHLTCVCVVETIFAIHTFSFLWENLQCPKVACVFLNHGMLRDRFITHLAVHLGASKLWWKMHVES